MSPFFLSEWIVYSNCTNHLCFEKEKFENFHKYTKDAIVIGITPLSKFKELGV